MTDLRTIIDDLRARLEQLPKIDSRSGEDVMDQHRRHRAAATELGEYLTETYGALIRERPDANTIAMRKIRSSSTSGLHGAFRNWITAAERRLIGS